MAPVSVSTVTLSYLVGAGSSAAFALDAADGVIDGKFYGSQVVQQASMS